MCLPEMRRRASGLQGGGLAGGDDAEGAVGWVGGREGGWAGWGGSTE